MSRNFLLSISNFLCRLEQLLLHGGVPPPALAGMQSNIGSLSTTTAGNKFSLKELIGDGVFWAVPKHRRSIEKRLKRKFGHPDYVWKPLLVKTNLRVCNQCGHNHEVGVLCPHCYDKVRQETQQMQDKIQEQLGLDPVDKEVVVLYDGEKGEQSAEALQGKRIVEMPKPRPLWFTKNLLQKSTQQQDETKEVKPSNLG